MNYVSFKNVFIEMTRYHNVSNFLGRNQYIQSFSVYINDVALNKVPKIVFFCLLVKSNLSAATSTVLGCWQGFIFPDLRVGALLSVKDKKSFLGL